MSIENTYREIITEDFVKEQLQQGIPVSATDLESELEDLIETQDLTVPQFVAEDRHVIRRTSSSASAFNLTFEEIRTDLRVLYREMLRLTQVSINAYERWDMETSAIEKKLIDLEDRIENLLLLTQDTEGYHSFVVDNFTDTSLTDLDLSDIELDLRVSQVALQPSGDVSTRIFLEELDLTKDLSFKVRTTTNFIARIDGQTDDLRNVFSQTSSAWWTNIEMKKVEPVTCELTVRLDPDTPVAISKIIMILHESSQSGQMTITPLYSVDNINFSQLPTNTFSQKVRSTAVFSFTEVEAQWVKFILTKVGPDPASGEDRFSYQFGFKEIFFYQEGFEANVAQSLISRPLFVQDNDGNTLPFEKLTLEVCEREETNTSIRYYVTTSDDPDVPVDSNTVWVPISPVDREDPLFPVILDVGETTESVFGDTEGETVDSEVVQISYDGLATSSDFVSPAEDFQLLSDDGGGGIDDDPVTATERRYTFINSNDRLLSYQIKDDVDIDLTSLQVFRNVGFQGLDPTDVTSDVRQIQRGWRFVDPWYSCVVEIENSDGMTIDVGDQAIIIDGVRYTGQVENTVLTGKTTTTTGLHTVSVHKNNWKHVTPDLDTLAALQAADPIYPYNHKLLVEGYSYGSSYPDTSEQLYLGVDMFAEVLMTRVSVFDILNNLLADNYDLFALDIDAPDSHTGGNDPTTVFLMKVDESNPDSQNERFVIRFNLINQLRNYLRVRADLVTTDEKTTPALHSYKVKLG
jgi:hypothetical protein